MWLAAVTAAAFFWRITLALRHKPLPARWMLIMVSIIGVAGVLLEYRTLFGQRAGVAMLLIFLGLKQLEARASRDGLAIVLLAYFLTLTQFFENQSIMVALTLIGTLLITTAALASLTDAQAPVIPLVRLSAVLLAQATPFMLILFILFPRVAGPLWGLPTDAYSSMTGLSDNMSPGTINKLIQSNAIAFRVQFDGPPPKKNVMYWRGPVLTYIDGLTWRPGLKTGSARIAYQHDPGGQVHDYAITLEPHNKHWLFALEFPATLPPNALVTSDYQLLARKPVRDRMRYDIRSRTKLAFAPEQPGVLREALALPASLNPRTRRLAARWRESEPDARRLLQHALDFMHEQRLVYTLQPPLMSSNVADDFLFDHKRGFCEHFSAAFVVLMRAAGVPARVVTGYQGGEHNPIDNTWVIRQSDAHAWTEIWIDGVGWLRVDPTAASAPARIEQDLAAAVPAGDPLPFLQGAGFDWLRNTRYQWWAISNAWNQWILGYNPERQLEFLSRLGMAAPDWRKMTALLATLSGGMLLLLAAAMLYRRPRTDAVQRAWLTLSRRLAKKGLARHPWEGPLDYAKRVAAALPESAADITSIARLYARLRYGNAPRADIAKLKKRIASYQP